MQARVPGADRCGRPVADDLMIPLAVDCVDHHRSKLPVFEFGEVGERSSNCVVKRVSKFQKEHDGARRGFSQAFAAGLGRRGVASCGRARR